MIIIRQKYYSSTWSKLKEAGKFGGLMGFCSAAAGAAIGNHFGDRAALIGALAVGIPVSIASAIFSYKTDSDSEKLDKEIKESELKYKKEAAERALKDPKKVFIAMSDSKRKIAGLKNLEKKYDVKFPPEFYKFIKLQEDFIPIAVKWVKDNNGMNALKWNQVVWVASFAEWIEEDAYYENIGELGFPIKVIEGTDPEYMSIQYSFKTTKFGWNAGTDRECYTPLKDIILYSLKENLKNNSDILSDEVKSLAKLYENFIKTRL